MVMQLKVANGSVSSSASFIGSPKMRVRFSRLSGPMRSLISDADADCDKPEALRRLLKSTTSVPRGSAAKPWSISWIVSIMKVSSTQPMMSTRKLPLHERLAERCFSWMTSSDDWLSCGDKPRELPLLARLLFAARSSCDEEAAAAAKLLPTSVSISGPQASQPDSKGSLSDVPCTPGSMEGKSDKNTMSSSREGAFRAWGGASSVVVCRNVDSGCGGTGCGKGLNSAYGRSVRRRKMSSSPGFTTAFVGLKRHTRRCRLMMPSTVAEGK
mmetsp:Transcript_39789/g.100020  ORF Transcript_39789/g.100020 Transcript_39789/m.100020 type:complete len:270 (-) Transcript_39789:291-1100(-)